MYTRKIIYSLVNIIVTKSLLVKGHEIPCVIFTLEILLVLSAYGDYASLIH